MRRLLLALASLMLATAATAQTVQFSAEERARILSHGPWPPALNADPSNRVSGNRAAVELGRRLFFDARLSGNGQIACATCHQPDRAWADGVPRAQGMEKLERNTQTLDNVRLQRWFGWGGASDSVWMASIRPLLDPREMDSSAIGVRSVYERDATLAACYRKAFGDAPGDSAMRTVVGTGKALGAFIETLATGRTPFDEFRDALARNDAAAMARYPAAAARGLKLFVGRGNCFMCHTGPNFTNGEFHDAGVPFFVAPGEADTGRHGGIQALRASELNRLGLFSDDRAGRSAVATRHVTLDHRHFGQFRVPSLRNVAASGPYMHNGSLATLRDVVRHYSELNEERLHADGERLLRALKLSPGEADDLVAFLESLTDRDGAQRPRPRPDDAACR